MAATSVQLPRRTVAGAATVSGIGLFTAKPSTIWFRPGELGGGIAFRRAGGDGKLIPARWNRVVAESRRTVLSADPKNPAAPTVQTVEHLMSALVGLGITDVVVDVDGPEIPIGDGSAKTFVDAILAVGIAHVGEQAGEVGQITKSVVLDDGKTRIEAHPPQPGAASGLELTYRLEYPPGAPILPQEATVFVPLGAAAAGYVEQIAPARTFCLAQEAQAMRQMGLFTHLTPKDMLVIGPDGPIDNAYRFTDEPARHKLLDMLGDLALAGVPVVGRVIATRTGHAHNHAMAAHLAAFAQSPGD